ncbi:MAG: RNA polymerase-interacting CarD/CdnL/TRCF family regulator [Kiritimatiellia bacterium]|jgi:RNA polymerase-interacting CarD/CdnL/TRCF family regulator
MASMWRVLLLVVLFGCTGAPASQESSSTVVSHDSADVLNDPVLDVVSDRAQPQIEVPPPVVVEPSVTRALDLTAGRRVLVPGHGVGQIEGREITQVEGVDTQVVTVSLESQAIAIPVESAHEIAREFISPSEAQDLLRLLRASGASTPKEPLQTRVARHQGVLAQDSSAELAVLLRDLYGMEGPMDDRDKLLILVIERDVLGEIAEVTHQNIATLRSEMRQLYHPRR